LLTTRGIVTEESVENCTIQLTPVQKEHSKKTETANAVVSTLNDNTLTLSFDQRDSSDFSIDDVQPRELNISSSQDVTTASNETHDKHIQSDEDTSNPFGNLLLFSDSENENATSSSKAAKQKERKTKSKRKPKKPERKIPDSFVAVRFSSPEIKTKIQQAQQSMVESDPKLKPTLISLMKLHITLLTLQLTNDTLIDKYVPIMA